MSYNTEKYYDYDNVKINLGSSDRTKEGFLNLDILAAKGVDIVYNLNKGIPLKDDSVTEIYAGHILEHLDDTVKIMEEIYRVCKNGAIVKIKVPYFKSVGAFKDPTHRRFFTEETFYYFNKKERGKRGLPDYGFKANFEIMKIAYIWSSSWLRFLPFKKCFFMKHFWNIVQTIYFELRVIK
jgi:ubiquinone/menaquinone biosynthesis C-methylase UbiE